MCDWKEIKIGDKTSKLNTAIANTPAKKFILYALSIGALELIPEGRPLKSGRISPYFFNSGLFNTGDAIGNLAKAYSAASDNFIFDVIYGPAYKGIPLAVAVAMEIGGSVGYAFNRKEAKDHGEGGIIVGSSLKERKVLLVDDVMTTGTSSGEGVEIIMANGGNPVGCVIAFDRQERGKETEFSAVQEFQEKYKLPVYAAATLADLICMLKDAVGGLFSGSEIDEILEKILAYQKQYGVEWFWALMKKCCPLRIALFCCIKKYLLKNSKYLFSCIFLCFLSFSFTHSKLFFYSNYFLFY